MRAFVRAVATGFALSMGTAIFKKVSKKLGLDDDSGSPSDSEKIAKKNAAEQGEHDDPNEDALH